jgi:hypothetical protein
MVLQALRANTFYSIEHFLTRQNAGRNSARRMRGLEYSGFATTRHSLIMNTIPPLVPLPRDQRNIDTDHLNLLSIFHFVVAGLALLGILVLIGECTMFHYTFANPDFWKNQKQPGPPPEFFTMFAWMFAFFGIWCLISAVLNVMAGIFLRQRKHRTFSLVVAGLNCVHVPVGTILGVFTIIVLVRPSVAELYEAEEH